MGQLAKTQGGAIARADSTNYVKSMILKPVAGVVKALVPDESRHGLIMAQFMRAVLLNPKLLDCSAQSLHVAMVDLAESGLELKGGQSWLIPRYNSKTQCQEANFQLGWRGWKRAMYATGIVRAVRMGTVHANDTNLVVKEHLGIFDFDRCMTGDRGKEIGYFATVETTDGALFVRYMTVDDVLDHKRKYVKFDGPGWKSSFDKMSQKTCLVQLARELPEHEVVERMFALEHLTNDRKSVDLRLDSKFVGEFDDGGEFHGPEVGSPAYDAEVVDDRSPGSMPDPE